MVFKCLIETSPRSSLPSVFRITAPIYNQDYCSHIQKFFQYLTTDYAYDRNFFPLGLWVLWHKYRHIPVHFQFPQFRFRLNLFSSGMPIFSNLWLVKVLRLLIKWNCGTMLLYSLPSTAWANKWVWTSYLPWLQINSVQIFIYMEHFWTYMWSGFGNDESHGSSVNNQHILHILGIISQILAKKERKWWHRSETPFVRDGNSVHSNYLQPNFIITPHFYQSQWDLL